MLRSYFLEEDELQGASKYLHFRLVKSLRAFDLVMGLIEGERWRNEITHGEGPSKQCLVARRKGDKIVVTID